jgi:signal transduction histidine kinase
LIVAAFLTAGVITWIVARGTAESELRENISLEISAIETELRTEGLEAAIAAIRARTEHPGAFEYWMTDARGIRLFGDYPDMQGPEGWRHMVAREDAIGAETREEMLIQTARLPGGILLSVGEDLGRARAVQDGVLTSLAWIGGGAVIASLVVGVFVTRRVLSRMDTLDATLARVATGDMDARFPIRHRSNSDLDRIGMAVNTMLERIKALVADIRRVSRDIAHDLRTPISHLQQHLEQAKSAETAADRLLALDGAQAKVTEILRIFDALLRLSEIEAGGARDRMRATDLAAVAEKVTDAYRPDVEDIGQSLNLRIIASRPVMGDADLLAQAIANLVENAMWHAPAGTEITVRIDADESSVKLTVSDDGPGIAESDRSRVLQPFVRLDPSRTTRGSGLGLSLVSAIASFHGAKLSLGDGSPGLIVCLEFQAERGRRPPDGPLGASE